MMTKGGGGGALVSLLRCWWSGTALYLCYHLIIILSSVGYTWLTTPSIVLYCIALYYIVLEHLYSAFSQHKALQKALHLYQHKEEEDQSLIKAGLRHARVC